MSGEISSDSGKDTVRIQYYHTKLHQPTSSCGSPTTESSSPEIRFISSPIQMIPYEATTKPLQRSNFWRDAAAGITGKRLQWDGREGGEARANSRRSCGAGRQIWSRHSPPGRPRRPRRPSSPALLSGSLRLRASWARGSGKMEFRKPQKGKNPSTWLRPRAYGLVWYGNLSESTGANSLLFRITRFLRNCF